MTNRFNFTKAAIDAIEPTGKQYDLIDTKVPSLRVRVNQNGSKTFNFYKKINGKVKRIKIANYKDVSIDVARNVALKINAQIAAGSDPQAEKNAKRKELVFKALYEAYYSGHAEVFTKRPQDNKKIIEKHILPKWSNERLSEITSDRVRKLHVEIGKDRGHFIANRVMHIVSAVFNYAIKEGHFKLINPCVGLKKFKTLSRDRFLNKEELAKFAKAIDEEEPLFRDYFLLLLYTGARKSNVLAMKFSDIDFDHCRWRIGEDETKNTDVNIVLLSPLAIDILNRRLAINKKLEQPSKFVFPSESESGHLQDPKRAFQRIRDRMEVQDIRMHDLRRTFGSYMAISGASLPMIGKALNHKSQASTVIYARLAQSSVLDAINTATGLMFK